MNSVLGLRKMDCKSATAISLKVSLIFSCLSVICLENEVDGMAFFDLSEGDIKAMIKPLGIVKKLIRLKKYITHDVSYTGEGGGGGGGYAAG